MIIDFSAHFTSSAAAKLTAAAGKKFSYPPESDNPEERLRLMRKYDIDMQVISPHRLHSGLGSKEAAEICKASNDSLYKLCARFPDRFKGLAILSLLDVESALEELDRAITDLDFKGVTISTNQNGIGLDSPDYLPFYDRVVKYDIPLFLHPTDWQSYPLIEGETGYRLMAAIGWPFDTTQAICRLIFGKILEKYPSLKIVTHHLGGFFPHSRVENSYESSLKDKLGLKKPLSEYLKQLYGDTALSGMGTIREEILSCGYAFFGPHRVVFGTDYPFGPENGEMYLRENLKAVKMMNVSEEDRREILEKTAKNLLKIP